MRKKIGLTFFVIVVFNCINSCSYDNENDKFSLERRLYTGNELKLDGYYYINRQDGLMTVYFFYSDGLLMHGGDFSPSNLSINEEWYRNGTYYQSALKHGNNWGVFQIDANTITFENMYPADAAWWVYRREGTIENDTTFHISYSVRVNGEDGRTRDETYHFRAFSPKPDSVCPFIP